MADRPLKLVGGFGSPYSRKMRALLRYRRIPFRWIMRGSTQDTRIPEVPVALIPVLVFPGADGAPDRAMIDSTPQIRELETLYKERAAVPPDPALAFIDALIEDYADEWLTKAMFHYRWTYEPDIEKASRVLALDRRLELAGEALEAMARTFAERQIGRLGVVGSNDTTLPVIEDSYRRLLAILSELVTTQPFVCGRRPGASDFGLFGQLSQLALFDPTSVGVAEREAPRVIAWLNRVDDLSWLEVEDADWITRDALGALRPLLQEVGRVYAPFLLANADALDAGAERVECTIAGRPWVQRTFPYQRKCLRALRERYASLQPRDRAAVDGALAHTGCGSLLA